MKVKAVFDENNQLLAWNVKESLVDVFTAQGLIVKDIDEIKLCDRCMGKGFIFVCKEGT